MILDIVKILAIISLLLLASFLPFLPGPYDGFATTLSMMVHIMGLTSMLLVLVGVTWLIAELRKSNNSFRFAIASLVMFSIVYLFASLPAWFNMGFSFWITVMVVYIYIV